jgi:hypothetical protein
MRAGRLAPGVPVRSGTQAHILIAFNVKAEVIEPYGF